MPSKDIKIYANEKEYRVGMIDDFEYIYYLPLEAREAIKAAATFSVQVAGVGLSTYSPTKQSLVDIKTVINSDKELTRHYEKSGKSTKDKLVEIQQLLEAGLISEDEYESMRKKVLGL